MRWRLGPSYGCSECAQDRGEALDMGEQCGVKLEERRSVARIDWDSCDREAGTRRTENLSSMHYVQCSYRQIAVNASSVMYAIRVGKFSAGRLILCPCLVRKAYLDSFSTCLIEDVPDAITLIIPEKTLSECESFN